MELTPFDRPGVFIAKILEHSVGKTTNGFPQWVARLQAIKKYAASPEELAEYGLTEPGYVDWDFNQGDISYFSLFGNDKKTGGMKRIQNFTQVMVATGWDGVSFASLAALDLAEKEILVRVEQDDYDGQTRFRVQWLDAADAPPVRTLGALDPAALNDLDAQFGGLMESKKTAAPARAAAAPKAAGAAAPKPAAPPKNPPKRPVAAPAAPAAPLTEADIPFEAEAGTAPSTKAEAWTDGCAKRVKMSDDDLGKTFTATYQKLFPGRGEDTITPADWGTFRAAFVAAVN